MSLPGHHLAVPIGSKCDEHPTEFATHNIQGETDSMGHEHHLMCAACYAAYALEADKPTMGWCAWCVGNDLLKMRNTDQVELVPVRDPDEGLSGPVYWVCKPCRTKQDQRIREELEQFNSSDMDDQIIDICPCGRLNCVEEDGHYDMLDMELDDETR